MCALYLLHNGTREWAGAVFASDNEIRPEKVAMHCAITRVLVLNLDSGSLCEFPRLALPFFIDKRACASTHQHIAPSTPGDHE
jgi:hypothetical protein